MPGGACIVRPEEPIGFGTSEHQVILRKRRGNRETLHRGLVQPGFDRPPGPGSIAGPIQAGRRASETDPVFSDAFRRWADSLSELGRYPEAIEKYRRAAKINPEDPDTHYNLGCTFHQ